ncbi:MAG: hypothetical protein ACR2QR_10320 [Woeseiaceae bacterium]
MQFEFKPSLVLLLGGLLGYGLAAGQFSALDPVRVAPHIFENVLENDKLRVLKVTERNGETPPLHSHPERLVVYLSPCAWMEAGTDGRTEMQSFRLGDVIWAAGLTHGGETSQVVQDCSRLEIELK